MSTSRAALGALCLSLLAAACGPEQTSDERACASLLAVVDDGTDALAEALAEPTEAQAAVLELADEIRAAADGASPALVTAADGLAVVYDDIADALAGGAPLDPAALDAAVVDLTERCS